MTARPTTVLVVDDEPPARTGLVRLLGRFPQYQVVGECGDGLTAIKAIRALQPELVLLDVQMPPPDGLGVVRAIGPDKMPAVIFVTAHERHATAAFEAHALDYVLKPFSERRLLEAMERAVGQLESRRLSALARRLLAVLGDSAPAGSEDRLAVRSIGKTEIIRVSEIRWIEAAGYCVRLHTTAKTLVHRETLQSLESRLPVNRFLRIHRSTLVNVDQIREARVTRSGEHELVLRDGTPLPVSRSRWAEVDALVRSWSKR